MPVIINGTTGIDTVQDGIVTDAKLNLTANSQEIKDALNAGGTAPIYACRAWVNFNGTGTVAIRASGNVTSITDRGTGAYTVNLSTAMPNTNFATIVTGQKDANDDGYVLGGIGTGGYTTSAIQVTMQSGSTGPDDLPTVSVAIFR
jgi:hypothetical protein